MRVKPSLVMMANSFNDIISQFRFVIDNIITYFLIRRSYQLQQQTNSNDKFITQDKARSPVFSIQEYQEKLGSQLQKEKEKKVSKMKQYEAKDWQKMGMVKQNRYLKKQSQYYLEYRIFQNIQVNKYLMKKGETEKLKNLMKIIYEKQKEIDRYKKQLRDKQRNKHLPVNEVSEMGITKEEKNYITREIIENKKFLEEANSKLESMQSRIAQLTADLSEQQNRNQVLEKQNNDLKRQCQAKSNQIEQLNMLKQLIQKSNNGRISQKELKIQTLFMENQKLKQIIQTTKCENNALKLRIKNIQIELNKGLRILYEKINFSQQNIKSDVDIKLRNKSRAVDVNLRHKIKTYTFIEQNLQKNLEDRLRQALELMAKWQQSLNEREMQWKANFEKCLSEHSLGGISHFISESIIGKQIDLSKAGVEKQENNNSFYEASLYKRQQEQLLKQLEYQCEKEDKDEAEVQKQKLMQFSEIKESLKMTKQVNEQLFDELNRQENIIKVFRQTFKNLEQKKLLKKEGSDEISKIRYVLAAKN